MKWLTKFFRKTGLKTRYMLSFVLVMAVPLFIFVFTLFNHQTKSLVDSIEELQLYRVEQMRDSFDARFSELEELCVAIAYNSKLRPEYLNGQKSHAIDSRDMIKTYENRSILTDNIFLYLFSEDCIYASDGRMSLQSMLDFSFMLDEEEKNWLREVVFKSTPQISMPYMDMGKEFREAVVGSNYMAYAYPLRQTGGRQYGTILCVIRKDKLRLMLHSAMGTVQNRVIVFDPNGQVIIGNGVEEGFDLPNVTELGQRGIINKSFTDDRWTLVYAKSKNTGFIYGLLIETNSMMNNVRTQQYRILITMLFVLAVGMILAAVLVHLHYRPIARLIKETGLDISTDGNMELDVIKNSMLSYMNKNRQLHQLVERHTSYVVERVFERLLGGLITEQEADDALMNSGCELRYGYFQVMAVSNADIGAAMNPARIWQATMHALIEIEMLYENELNIYVVEKKDSHAVLLLLNIADEDDYSQVIYQQITRQINDILVVGVGKVYDDMMQVQQSCMEALAALERARYQNDQGIVKFELIDSVDGQNQRPERKDAERLIQSMKMGNEMLAHTVLNSIYQSMVKLDSGSIAQKCLQINLIDKVVQLLMENGEEAYRDKIILLLNTNSASELYQAICTIISDYCVNAHQQSDLCKEDMKRQLEEYVMQHFMEADMSLERVADAMNLSSGYVSRFFGEQMHESFKDYISNLRIERSQVLLTETDMTLQEIVLKVGYYNVSSFIRKFKSITGLAPGEYRKLYYKKKIEEDS